MEGHKHFSDMKFMFGIVPKAACHVEFGLLEDAYELVRIMLMEHDVAVWMLFLMHARCMVM